MKIWIMMLMACITVMAAEDAAEVPNPKDAIQHLAFMEGSWELKTFIYRQDGSVARQSKAKMMARPIFGGLGMLESREYPAIKPDGLPYFVSLIYSVKPQTGKVVGVLNNTLGNRKLLTQEDGAALVFKMTGELFGGAKGYALLRYVNTTENSFELVQDYCPDDGTPCREKVFSFIATRIE